MSIENKGPQQTGNIELKRRSFLKGAAVGATAAVLGAIANDALENSAIEGTPVEGFDPSIEYEQVGPVTHFQKNTSLDALLRDLQSNIHLDRMSGVVQLFDDQGRSIRRLSEDVGRGGEIAMLHISLRNHDALLRLDYSFKEGMALSIELYRRLSDGKLVARESGSFFTGKFTFDLE